MKNMKEELHELCEVVSEKIADANKKIRSTNGMLSNGDVDYLDKLTHMLKSIKGVMLMLEEEDGEGASYRSYAGRSMAGSNRGGSYYGGSYEGGMSNRGRNRDSMGRFSREGGYSAAGAIDEMVEEMRGMMGELPEEQRREVQRFVDKMGRM